MTSSWCHVTFLKNTLPKMLCMNMKLWSVGTRSKEILMSMCQQVPDDVIMTSRDIFKKHTS